MTNQIKILKTIQCRPEVNHPGEYNYNVQFLVYFLILLYTFRSPNMTDSSPEEEDNQAPASNKRK